MVEAELSKLPSYTSVTEKLRASIKQKVFDSVTLGQFDFLRGNAIRLQAIDNYINNKDTPVFVGVAVDSISTFRNTHAGFKRKEFEQEVMSSDPNKPLLEARASDLEVLKNLFHQYFIEYVASDSWYAQESDIWPLGNKYEMPLNATIIPTQLGTSLSADIPQDNSSYCLYTARYMIQIGKSTDFEARSLKGVSQESLDDFLLSKGKANTFQLQVNFIAYEGRKENGYDLYRIMIGTTFTDSPLYKDTILVTNPYNPFLSGFMPLIWNGSVYADLITTFLSHNEGLSLSSARQQLRDMPFGMIRAIQTDEVRKNVIASSSKIISQAFWGLYDEKAYTVNEGIPTSPYTLPFPYQGVSIYNNPDNAVLKLYPDIKVYSTEQAKWEALYQAVAGLRRGADVLSGVNIAQML